MCVAIIAFWQYRYPSIYHLNSALDVSLVAVGFAGGYLGLLWWNAEPATVAMGSTGSLSVGSALAAACILLRLDFLLLIIGGLYLIVLLSVLIQMASFRLFRYRPFRMAPIQYHFEVLGWPESTVIVRFWIVAALCSALGLGIFYGDWSLQHFS